MKKVILGSFMMLSGLLGTAILLASTMANTYSSNGKVSFLWTLSFYGLIPALVIFTVIGIVGFLLGIWGMSDKKG